MLKICELWSCDMNSTLGSVAPLAMFVLNDQSTFENSCWSQRLLVCAQVSWHEIGGNSGWGGGEEVNVKIWDCLVKVLFIKSIIIQHTPHRWRSVCQNLGLSYKSSVYQVKYHAISMNTPHQRLQPAQNFWVYSEFLSFFVLHSRLLADFLSHFGKWVKLIKFEAENEFFCTWKVEKPQCITSSP